MTRFSGRIEAAMRGWEQLLDGYLAEYGADPTGLKCQTVEGRPECKIDTFKDKDGKIISREEAMRGGNWLSKLFKVDPASRIARLEGKMTAKYAKALALKAAGGSVTIKGSVKLGVSQQTISGDKIVTTMEATNVVATAEPPPHPDMVAGTEKYSATGVVKGIVFYKNGSRVGNVERTFGHEALHAAYSWPSTSDRG